VIVENSVVAVAPVAIELPVAPITCGVPTTTPVAVDAVAHAATISYEDEEP
jgi:hypothetical protein